jgi:Tfp pilus assembly PilM family ATPase
MRAADLEPVGMHNEFTATMHAFGAVGEQSMEDAGSATLYLDIGAGSTKVTITHGRSLAFAKTIEIGGRHLDEAVAQQRGLKTPAEARAQRLAMKSFDVPEGAAAPSAPETEGMALLAAAMRREGGERASGSSASGPAVAGGADLSEPLEMLTDEVSMCLRYHHAAFPDERLESIVFMGGESRHLALCQHISRVLKLSAQVGDPLANVLRAGDEPVSGVVLDGPQPGWTVALGLCLAPTDL